MFCSKCGDPNGENVRFCRKCGADMEITLGATAKQSFLDKKNVSESLTKTYDPDEMTGKGIGGVIIGDGFLMVAVILSASHSAVSSLLWLFLLIPAFFFFGKGFADILHARQIRRRRKPNELNDALRIAELLPPSISFIDTIKKHTSGDLVPVPSVTERTTRNLR